MFRSSQAPDILTGPARESYLALSKLHKEVRDEFLVGDKHKFFNPEAWKAGCDRAGHAAANLAKEFLESLPKEVVKARAMKMSGLDNTEHLLLIAPDRSWTSYGNKNYTKFISKLQTADVKVDKQGKGLRFALVKEEETLITFDVPFTVNANGAWYKPAEKYEGVKVYKNEGELFWGQRRPRKSRELASSVNTYVDFTEVLRLC